MKTKNNQLREQRVEKRVLENLNNKIEEQIKTLGETIKSSILEEIQSSLTKVESKVDQVKTSYAAVTKVSTPVTTSGLKTIVKEARYEEMREKRDHDNRQNNVIIHGVSESAVEQNDAEDKKFVESLIKTIRIPTPNIKSISRIGASATDKRRPIKVVLRSEKEKMNFLRNLSVLKGNSLYKGVSVTEDLTQTERSVLKEWTEKAKDLNLDDTDWLHRVRGDSKNGYYLKKFPRRPNQ